MVTLQQGRPASRDFTCPCLRAERTSSMTLSERGGAVSFPAVSPVPRGETLRAAQPAGRLHIAHQGVLARRLDLPRSGPLNRAPSAGLHRSSSTDRVPPTELRRSGGSTGVLRPRHLAPRDTSACLQRTLYRPAPESPLASESRELQAPRSRHTFFRTPGARAVRRHAGESQSLS